MRAVVPVESWVRWALKGWKQVPQKFERAVVPELRNSVRAAVPVFQRVYSALEQVGLAQELDRQACSVLVQAARVE